MRIVRTRPFQEQVRDDRTLATTESTSSRDAGVPLKIESCTLPLPPSDAILLDMCFLNDRELVIFTTPYPLGQHHHNVNNNNKNVIHPQHTVDLFLRSVQFTAGFTPPLQGFQQQKQMDQEAKTDRTVPMLISGSLHLSLPASAVMAFSLPAPGAASLSSLSSLSSRGEGRFRVLSNWRKKGSLTSLHFPTGRVNIFDMHEGE